MAAYDVDGSLQQAPDDGNLEGADSAEPDSAPAPWYRNRVLLALWVLAVALLLALIIYGLVELSRGGGGGSPGRHHVVHDARPVVHHLADDHDDHPVDDHRGAAA